jgi:hypothetical protein
VSTAALNARLKKVQSAGDGGLTLEQWAAKAAKHLTVIPRHILVSLVAGQMLTQHAATALEGHPLYRAWINHLGGESGADDSFQQFCLRRGTDIERVLSEARKTMEH